MGAKKIKFFIVSIHAPARGATCFRPFSWFASLEVSIHAPARGATCVIMFTDTLA